jgi:transposase
MQQENIMTRTVLKDEDWGKIKLLLPVSKNGVGRPPKDHRLMLEGICWVLRTGAPWRDLPKEFGPWESVYYRLRDWSKKGIWEDIWRVLKKRIRQRVTYD